MDPTTTFCPNRHCPARGQTGQGNIGIHSQKEQRFICHECHKTFSATQRHRLLSAAHLGRDRGHRRDLARPWVSPASDCGGVWLRRADDSGLVGTLWRQGQAVHEYLVEQPRDLGQVQADELRVKKQGGIVWMALAMMVTTRLWLGGEVSEQRDLPLIRRLIERVRRCAGTSSPVGLYRWLGAPISGPFGRPFAIPYARGRADGPGCVPGATSCIAQVVKRYERRRVVDDRTPHCRWHACTRRDAPTPLARRRGDQHGLHRTAQRDVPCTSRSPGSSVPGAGTRDPDAARGDVLGGDGL